MTADDGHANLVSRTAALPVDPCAHPDPPAGPDLTATWPIPVRTIETTDHNLTLNSINAARADAGLRATA
ncbi:hypothetical protein [Streptomyces atratus]|uniref:hypothetical protein n=1 Tax=Streptomyces atratus TaxID=1893 RepID=UPI0036521516